MQKIPITPAGWKRLNEELRHLKAVERPAAIQALVDARAQGEFGENADYHAAHEHQSFIEGRIAQLEEIIASADVVDADLLSGDSIKFGAHVRLLDEETGCEVAFQLVGTPEADIRAGRLSMSAPLARALIGRKAGDIISVSAPGGDRTYEILGIRFGH
jgi:transcription elongation factor GreA